MTSYCISHGRRVLRLAVVYSVPVRREVRLGAFAAECGGGTGGGGGGDQKQQISDGCQLRAWLLLFEHAAVLVAKAR
jgi:hypothetical protein